MCINSIRGKYAAFNALLPTAQVAQNQGMPHDLVNTVQVSLQSSAFGSIKREYSRAAWRPAQVVDNVHWEGVEPEIMYKSDEDIEKFSLGYLFIVLAF